MVKKPMATKPTDQPIIDLCRIILRINGGKYKGKFKSTTHKPFVRPFLTKDFSWQLTKKRQDKKHCCPSLNLTVPLHSIFVHIYFRLISCFNFLSTFVAFAVNCCKRKKKVFTHGHISSSKNSLFYQFQPGCQQYWLKFNPKPHQGAHSHFTWGSKLALIIISVVLLTAIPLRNA